MQKPVVPTLVLVMLSMVLALLIGGCFNAGGAPGGSPLGTAGTSSAAGASGDSAAGRASQAGSELRVSLAVCGAPATRVRQMQGEGTRSSHVGATLPVEGIVVGDFQRKDG